ncbi:hypothetical protein ACS0TY_002819 [Phlomoides rotata]
MDLNAIQDSFERVAKRQKLSSSGSQELVNQVCHEIEQALVRIKPKDDSAVSVDQKTILTELKAKLQAVGSYTHLEGPLRDLNMNLGKYQRVLERGLHPDISKACRTVDFDTGILNQIIISHLYSEGLFDIVDCLLKEASEPEAISLRLQYQEIHQILKALKSKNLDPALNWISENRERLKELGSDLELKVHGLRFVDILQNQSRGNALKYAKTHLAPLASVHMNEIQKLMCSLLWAGKLDKSPYSDLLDPIHWEKFGEELRRTICNLLGRSITDPLTVSVAAGMEGLPTLLKLVSVMAAKKNEWQAMKNLPVPIELGKEFQFHSIFVCPVSCDQSSEQNPPMLLPCGHVLCKQSIRKLSKGNTRGFKCPYCPREAWPAHCKHLYL